MITYRSLSACSIGLKDFIEKEIVLRPSTWLSMNPKNKTICLRNGSIKLRVTCQLKRHERTRVPDNLNAYRPGSRNLDKKQ